MRGKSAACYDQPGNWKLIRAYLKYRWEVDQISDKSLRLEESWLRHLLEWMNEKPVTEVAKIRPVFPEYLLTARMDGKYKQLSAIYIKKIIRAAYRFLSWVVTHKRGYSSITQAYLDTLKPPRMDEEPSEHEAVTLDEIRAIAKAPVYSLRDRRIRAAAVFWFLSGIRIGAFVTLPLSAVDLDTLTVRQWPRLGVRTKFRKHATTFLLDIPDLLSVVRAWDEEIRSICKNDGIWFAPINPETGEIEPRLREVGKHRHTRARDDLRDWMEPVGLPYHSPHKFRHGFAVYATKRAKDVPALKAVSQNLMHSNLSTTDGIYGVLSEYDVRGEITTLGNLEKPIGKVEFEEMLPILKKLLDHLEEEK